MRFVMTGGGTGGHVIPALAVARELRQRGHQVSFIGTLHGFESKLVPAEGFPIEFIRIGGFNRTSLRAKLGTLGQLLPAISTSAAILRHERPGALFSMGGYVAGPPMLAARLTGLPMVLMEPNAIPGLVSRWMGKSVRKALLSFEEAAPYFRSSEVTGLPVRQAFFEIPAKLPGEELTVLVTGGSQGSRRINEAVRDAWPLLRSARRPIRLIHQTGQAMHAELLAGFGEAGLPGEVTPFLTDMPAAFAQADVVVSRAGAGAVAELCAAGKPSILIPFPFAADDHQLKNARAMVRAGASRLAEDRDLSGTRLVQEILSASDQLEEMGRAARRLARPGAAARAASILEETARERQS
jgi:UDP-N-acetylglucosamine--N-acetylmuramyl-(pentapeptide) pyrophosphoryl-undecaprenol N-acetylglucosamine transferase